MYYHLAILWNQLGQFNSAMTSGKYLNLIFKTKEQKLNLNHHTLYFINLNCGAQFKLFWLFQSTFGTKGIYEAYV